MTRHPQRKSILCPNCRKLVSVDERICPYCGVQAPGARWKNSPLTQGWGDGEVLLKGIIWANAGLFVLSLLLAPKALGFSMNPLFFFSPTLDSLVRLGGAGAMTINGFNGWWTLLSANYLHGSILHIVFNMMALMQISRLVQQLYGIYRFFLIYTLSGVAGFLLSYLVGIPLTIGASAAICGLIGAALFYGKDRGGIVGQTLFKQIGGWAISILFIGFIIPGINNWAHIGGMAAGAGVAFVLGYHEKKRETQRHRFMAAACALITIAVLFWSVLKGLYHLLF